MFNPIRSLFESLARGSAELIHRIPFATRLLDWRRKHRRRFGVIVLSFWHVLGGITTIPAVMNTRTSQGTIAWVVSLNTIPMAAVPAYWFFGGSKMEDYVSERKKAAAETRGDKDGYLAQLEQHGLLADAGSVRDRVLRSLTGMPVSQGNDIELLIDGDATFRSIFDGLRTAKDYVLVQFYILRDTGIGLEFKTALLDCAARGVRVHVLYDDMGSKDLPSSYEKELRRAGIQIHGFNGLYGNLGRGQLNFRNHRKAVIVDGAMAWVGGINVGDEYMGLDPKVGPWRDTFVKFQGPAVQAVQIAYAEDWHWAAKEQLSLNNTPQPASTNGSKAVLVLPSGPADALETCSLFHLHLINTAQNRLWIASPYFVPDEQFISALHLAALRGVDVKIIVPDKSDGILVDLSGWSFVQDLEASGVRFYRHLKGFMHQKVIVVDDDICTVGTANFDNRSFRLNFELTIATFDKAFTGTVARMLEADLNDSRLVEPQELRNKGFWWEFSIRASRALSPVQ